MGSYALNGEASLRVLGLYAKGCFVGDFF